MHKKLPFNYHATPNIKPIGNITFVGFVFIDLVCKEKIAQQNNHALEHIFMIWASTNVFEVS